MALVAYGDSDSEISGDEEEVQAPSASEPVTPAVTLPKGKLSSFLPKPKVVPSAPVIEDDEEDIVTSQPSTFAETESSKVSLFASLPKPTRIAEVNGPVEASDDVIEDFVKKKEEPVEKPPPKPTLMPGVTRTASGKVKIMLPSLKDLGPVDDDDEQKPPPPKLQKSGRSSGLFAVLPPPKERAAVKSKAAGLVPLSVSRPKPPPAPARPPAKRPAAAKPEESDDEEEVGDFFGFNAKDPVPIVPIFPTEIISVPSPRRLEEPEPVAVETVETVQPASLEAMASSMEAPATDLLQDEDALLKLQGKRARMQESMDIIEVNAESHLPSAHDWMTKQLTQEQPVMSSASRKAGKMPGRHKHQITYLAQMAKERELELKNQWAENRYTKRQTQSKYGF